MVPATILCLILMLPASGGTVDGGLAGHWKITAPNDATYSGDLLVDADGRAVMAGTSATRSGHLLGYVERGGPSISIVLTDRKGVWHIRCAHETRDVLNCDTRSANGDVSSMYYMRRTH